MKNLLIIVLENPDSTLAENKLSAELGSEIAVKFSNYLSEITISETYPVEFQYEMALAVYKEKDINFLDENFGNYCKILTSNESSMGKFIYDIAVKQKEYTNIIFLKSNTSGLMEENLIGFFDKLKANNIIFGQSGENSFYLFGLNQNIIEDLKDLTEINSNIIESFSDEAHLLVHYLPDRNAVENINSLSVLRDSISEKTSLSTTIDRLVLGKDRIRHLETK